MQDRIPVNPGRVLISPENGAAYYATMSRADNATQEGTPLNKNSLLRDATADLFGLGANAVPDDVFSWIGQYNTHWWQRRTNDSHYVSDVYDFVENATVLRSNDKYTEYSIKYSESLAINHLTGEFDLLNPKTVSVSYSSYSNANVLKGKYYKPNSHGSEWDIRFTPANAPDVTRGFDSYYCVWANSYAVKTVFVDGTGEWELVHSSDKNTYPLPDDVFEYQYLGIPFQNAVTAPKISTGSYTGTSSGYASLTFDFEPKFVYVQQQTDHTQVLIWVDGSKISPGVFGTGSWGRIVTRVGKTISWYCGTSGSSWSDHMNLSGAVYNYIAIG